MAQGPEAYANGVAIIGMSCRFAGAGNVEAYWRNLRDGVESISFFSDEEVMAAGVAPETVSDPAYVKAKPIVEQAEWFDAAFFRISPGEAEAMDPQHRLLLECAWEALENAGYNPFTGKGRIGIYAGTDRLSYAVRNLIPSYSMSSEKAIPQYLTENDKDYLCTRIAYKLNLRGPSMTVQTACSTALYAVHLACEGLLTGECDMALAGGVSVSVPLKEGYFYVKEGLLSPDGHCRSFDAEAQGTVFGNGIGIVALKRLEEALKDGDFIHAVIRGSAINNDGALRLGFTAPGVEGQAAVIAEAMEVAGVGPESIGYVEAHGSATPLGDLVEITALTRAFRLHTQAKGFCAVGTAKSNIGHASTAAGAAGLIKAVLSLKHELIPPSLHFKSPNPKIDFDNSPFFVNTTLREWKREGTPRRAGVSSFGMGGANAHVVLEEAPEPKRPSRTRPEQLLLLSACTATALETATNNLLEHLRAHQELSLADVSYTLQAGRAAFDHRRVLVCHDMDDAIKTLAARDPERVLTAQLSAREEFQQGRAVAFMFPGVGDHYPGMTRELYRTEPEFRRLVDRCAAILKPHLGCDLLSALFPPQTEENREQATPLKPQIDLRRMLGRDGDCSGPVSPLHETWLAQPAVFVIEYALARLLMSWGLRPRAMIGYSLGEYVVACLAGVMSLEDALRLVARRARMIQSVEPGAMLTVALSEVEVRAWTNARVALSGVLAPNLTVLGGPADATDELESKLTTQGIACRRLATTHAFHTPMLRSIQQNFAREVQSVRFKAPEIPYLSNVTGDWITSSNAPEAGYWVDHLCQPVQLCAGLARLTRDPNQLFLEVGPGRSLGSFIQQQCPEPRLILPTVPFAYEKCSGSAFLLDTLARLWLAGVEIDWQQYSTGEHRRVPLPSYPFEREKYWIQPATGPSVMAHAGEIPEGKRKESAAWFYRPAWTQTQLNEPSTAQMGETKGPWLLFVDRGGCGSRVARCLKLAGQQVFEVVQGTGYQDLGGDSYSLDPARPEDYSALLKGLPALPAQIIHAWGIDPPLADSAKETFVAAQRTGFYSIVFLAAALDHHFRDFRLWCLTNRSQAISDSRVTHPELAPVPALCLVIAQEKPQIRCHAIDLEWPLQPEAQAEWLMKQLMVEFSKSPSEADQGAALIAYRGLARWRRMYEPAHLVLAEKPVLRSGGVYLITGGLGGIGTLIAGYLAENFQAKLILTGRSEFPLREGWPAWLASHSQDDSTSRRICKIMEWESQGSEVCIFQADVTDEEPMKMAVEHFGCLHGVFYAAGIVNAQSSALVQDISKTQAEAHFAAKAYGLYVLERVLAGRKLDFCLLFSSLSSLLGGLGLGAYAAANAFMDSFAAAHNSRDLQWWSVVNWDAWPAPDNQLASGSAVKNFAMSQSEALEALERVISHPRTGRLVNSTGDLQSRLNRWVYRLVHDGGAAAGRHKRPQLMGHYVPPGNEIEELVADIWQQFLGVSPVGIRDNFFALGGQSLLAVQIVARLRTVLQIELPLNAFVQAPTVAELAAAINQIITERALEEIENYSEEDAEKLISGTATLETARGLTGD